MNIKEKIGKLKTKILEVGEDLETIYSDMREINDETERLEKQREEKHLLNQLKNLSAEFELCVR